jgi:hypothetical protein
MPATLRRIAAPTRATVVQAAEAGPLDRNYWIDAGIEPALAELLADPIMHAVMRADGVRLQEVLAAVPRH